MEFMELKWNFDGSDMELEDKAVIKLPKKLERS
jgi:hypothetical protein